MILLTGGLASDAGLVACLKDALQKQAKDKGSDVGGLVRTRGPRFRWGNQGGALGLIAVKNCRKPSASR